MDNIICCICLDEIYTEMHKDEMHMDIELQNAHFNFDCCNGVIHKRCLLLLLLNEFEDCPLCRSTIDIKKYYNIKMLNYYLTINEIRLYKKRIYNLLSRINCNIIVYLYIEIRLFIGKPILYFIDIIKFICILSLVFILFYTLYLLCK